MPRFQLPPDLAGALADLKTAIKATTGKTVEDLAGVTSVTPTRPRPVPAPPVRPLGDLVAQKKATVTAASTPRPVAPVGDAVTVPAPHVDVTPVTQPEAPKPPKAKARKTKKAAVEVPAPAPEPSVTPVTPEPLPAPSAPAILGRKIGGMDATPEQVAIVDAALADAGLRAVAFAGTGKTTTLKMIASEKKGKGFYLAFNKAIQLEAERKFPKHVACKTAHGVAFGAMAVHTMKDRLRKRLYPQDVVKILGLTDPPRGREGFPADLTAQFIIDTVTLFCQSADHDIGPDHALVPPEAMDAVIAGAKRLWERMTDRRAKTPFVHDVYLKNWQLGTPTINADYILFDEAQDANPVMIDIAVRQGVPIIWCGDPHQQIYAFRGACNAMRQMPGQELYLTQSWRFGQAIAEVGNAILHMKPEDLRPPVPLIGNPHRASTLGPVCTTGAVTLCRTNAMVFEHAVSTTGSVHVVGGVEDLCLTLQAGYDLWAGHRVDARVPAIARFASFAAMKAHAHAHDDRELTFVARVVEDYERDLPKRLADLQRRYVEDESQADAVFSTAHKAKGREWSQVRLADDFRSPGDEKWKEMLPVEQEAELNLLYVAATRAIDCLEPNIAVNVCRGA